jgi:drug/metabolite transporter (DMT)-like permease
MVQAGLAMALVGGAVTASSYLRHYPRYGAQAIRYLLAAVVLALVARRSARWNVQRPVGPEWWWLVAASTAGLAVYNLAIVGALDHAEPALVASIVAGVPLVLAAAVPLAGRRRVPRGVVLGAAAVVAGAVIVVGGGHSDAAGIAFAAVALGGECGFTLLSLPVLSRLGAMSVALHTTWIAALQLTIVGMVADGRHVLAVPDQGVTLALLYLVAASAIAFALWFSAVASIGGELAGLAAGVIPVSAAVTGVPLGVAAFTARGALGTAVVSIGVILGVRTAAEREPGARA